MSNPMFIPVYGNSKEINEKIAATGMSDKFSALPPLQVIFSGEGAGMQLDNSDLSKLSEDICFIVSNDGDTEEDILSLLGLSTAPIRISPPESSPDDEDQFDEESILSAMEDDIEENNDDLVNKYRRFQETLARIQTALDDDNEPGAVIIHSRGKIIDSMIYPGSGSSVFLVQFPTLYTSSVREMDVPDVVPDPDAPISCAFNAFRVDGYAEGASPDNNGEYLVVTDTNALMFIETMTPCVVTSISLVDEDTIVSSWIIHGESVDGMSPVVTKQVIDELGDSLMDDIGVDPDHLTYKWPADIPVSPFSILAPVAVDEEVIKIIDSIQEDYEGFDEDDDNT